MTASDSRGIVAPWVLQIDSVRAPASRANFTAMSVSIVSPDWLTEMTSVEVDSTGSR